MKTTYSSSASITVACALEDGTALCLCVSKTTCPKHVMIRVVDANLATVCRSLGTASTDFRAKQYCLLDSHNRVAEVSWFQFDWQYGLDNTQAPLFVWYEGETSAILYSVRMHPRSPLQFPATVVAHHNTIYSVPHYIRDLFELTNPVCARMKHQVHTHILCSRARGCISDITTTISLLMCELFRVNDYREYCLSKTDQGY